jgi:hypothetical protein
MREALGSIPAPKKKRQKKKKKTSPPKKKKPLPKIEKRTLDPRKTRDEFRLAL